MARKAGDEEMWKVGEGEEEQDKYIAFNFGEWRGRRVWGGDGGHTGEYDPQKMGEWGDNGEKVREEEIGEGGQVKYEGFHLRFWSDR